MKSTFLLLLLLLLICCLFTLTRTSLRNCNVGLEWRICNSYFLPEVEIYSEVRRPSADHRSVLACACVRRPAKREAVGGATVAASGSRERERERKRGGAEIADHKRTSGARMRGTVKAGRECDMGAS